MFGENCYKTHSTLYTDRVSPYIFSSKEKARCALFNSTAENEIYRVVVKLLLESIS